MKDMVEDTDLFDIATPITMAVSAMQTPAVSRQAPTVQTLINR